MCEGVGVERDCRCGSEVVETEKKDGLEAWG